MISSQTCHVFLTSVPEEFSYEHVIDQIKTQSHVTTDAREFHLFKYSLNPINLSVYLTRTVVFLFIFLLCCFLSLSAPTVVVDITADDSLMDQEIFGPVLPILTFESLQEGIDFVNTKEKPLALYVYSDESSVRALRPPHTHTHEFVSFFFPKLFFFLLLPRW